MNHEPNFHLYLLIGQSNMSGRGQVEAQDREIHSRVFALNRDSQWAPAADPIHFDKPIAGVGPGPTFGKALADRDPALRIGLIPCAVGGSPLATWTPGGFWEQTHSHPYDDALVRARIASEQGTLRGILWHQGESDSNERDAATYLDRLAALVEALRAELDAPELPFVCATLGDFYVARNPWAGQVNQALRRVPQRIQHAVCVDATGLGHGGDELHFDAQAARELGRRYAQAMICLQAGQVDKVVLAEKLGLLSEYWSPRVVGALNEQYVKVAKLKGEFIWHHHKAEDELFLVLKGRLVIQLRGRDVTLEEGDFLIVPRGIEHRPIATEEAHVLLFEPQSTVNTGNVRDEHTVDGSERI
jgi:mannose-6-phosphate isomerase-like protein (cupin superfamily)